MMYQNNAYNPQFPQGPVQTPQPQYQQAYNGVQQNVQPQNNAYGQSAPLHEVTGQVISVQPHLDPTGQQKISSKGAPMWKIQIQTPHGQPNFWYFQNEGKPTPQFGTQITAKYRESPNNRGGSPVKTIAFFDVINANTQQGIPQQAQTIQPVQQSSPTQPNNVQPVVNATSMEQHVQQCKQNGINEAMALGMYILQNMQNTTTYKQFKQYWG